MKLIHLINCCMLFCCMHTMGFAGWQYDGYLMDDGFYEDDGTKFIISLRGGLSLLNSHMKNEMGSIYGYYYVNQSTGDVITDARWEAAGEPSGYIYAGYGDLSNLPLKQSKLSKNAFAAGASLGFTIPYYPQWRLEAGWDHVSEIEYNETPLFRGDLKLSGGDITDALVQVDSGGAVSSMSTDIISAMIYYDFFDGQYKQANKFIPYIGFGIGYADSTTKLKLSDIYGDLSSEYSLQNYGELSSDGVLQFYTSEKSNTNVAALGAVGVAYGITQSIFLELNARVMYIPNIKWILTNSDNTQQRNWFTADNVIYTNFMCGIRFEF